MSDTLQLSAAAVDLARREVRRQDGTVVPLSELEVTLLAWLAAHAGQPASRDRLLVEVWGFPKPVPTRAVDNTVSRLRCKIEADATAPDHLQTVRGRGYVLELPPPVPAAVPAAAAAPSAAPSATASAGARLRVPPTSFFGRAAELEKLRWLLARKRLLTVVGPGGAGKTRLVARWLDDPSLPVHAALSLAHIDDRPGLLGALAAALGVALGGTERDQAVLARALAARGPGVLVLDNLEQLTSVLRGTVDAWVLGAPELRVLATSRVALGLPGELCLSVGSMTPADALRLFEARLTAQAPDQVLGPEERAAARELLARVEHQPLCVELLASRAATMGVAEVAHRLEQMLLLLDRSGAAVPHQRSLQATLRWSWELLSTEDQAALAALSVFGGSFDFELAAAVLDCDPTHAITSLRRASLLERDELPGHHPRYHLLLPVRAFARLELAGHGARDDIAQRLATALWGRIEGWAGLDSEARAQARLAEAPNLIAAGEAVSALDPGLACDLLLEGRGGDALASHQQPDAIERVVALGERSGDGSRWARARATLAHWHRLRGDPQASVAVLRPVLDDSRAGRGHPLVLVNQAIALNALNRSRDVLIELAHLLAHPACTEAQRSAGLTAGGTALQMLDRRDEAEQSFREALAVAIATQDRRAEAVARSNLACLIMTEETRRIEARAELQAALQLDISGGQSRPWMMNLAAWLDLVDGRLEVARKTATDGLALAQRAGSACTTQFCKGTLSWVAALEGRLEDNERLLLEALSLTRRQGSRLYTLPLLVSLAVVAARQGRLDQAETWLAEVDAAGTHDLPQDLVEGITLQRRIVDLARTRTRATDAAGVRREVEAELVEARERSTSSTYLLLITRLVTGCLHELRPSA